MILTLISYIIHIPKLHENMKANSMIIAFLINLSMFSSYKMCCYLYFVRLCLQVVQKKYQEKSGTGGSLGEIKSYGLQMSPSKLTQHLKHIHNVNAPETGTKESQPQIVTYMKNLSELLLLVHRTK